MSRPEKHDRLILNKADWVCYLLNYLKRCRLILNIADWVCNVIRKEFISVNSTEKNSKEYYNTCGQREEEQRWWQMKPIKFWNIETLARQNHNKLNPEIKGFWEKQKERSWSAHRTW